MQTGQNCDKRSDLLVVLTVNADRKRSTHDTIDRVIFFPVGHHEPLVQSQDHDH